jgi:hypothetical protein
MGTLSRVGRCFMLTPHGEVLHSCNVVITRTGSCLRFIVFLNFIGPSALPYEGRTYVYIVQRYLVSAVPPSATRASFDSSRAESEESRLLIQETDEQAS